MMQQFAHWLVASRVRAALVTAALLLVFGPISGAILALVTMERGEGEGLAVTGLAAVAWFTVLSVARFGLDATVDLGVGLEMVVVNWLSALGMAWVWTRFGSLNLAWQVCAAVAAITVIVAYLLVDNLHALWLVRIDQFVETLTPDLREPDRGTFVRSLAGVMQGAFTGTMVVLGLIALAMGRWWHRLLHDQTGIGGDFRRIRLGKALTGLAGVIFLGAWLTGWGVLENLTVLFVILFIVQGFSVVHYLTVEGGWPWYGLVMSYVIVAFVSPIGVPFITTLGLVDNIMDTRRRLYRKTEDT